MQSANKLVPKLSVIHEVTQEQEKEVSRRNSLTEIITPKSSSIDLRSNWSGPAEKAAVNEKPVDLDELLTPKTSHIHSDTGKWEQLPHDFQPPQLSAHTSDRSFGKADSARLAQVIENSKSKGQAIQKMLELGSDSERGHRLKEDQGKEEWSD